MFERRVVVQPWAPNCFQTQYDAFFCALGFERRSRCIAETFLPRSERLVAMAFPDRKFLSYAQNEKWFTSNGYRIEEIFDLDFKDWFRSNLSEVLESAGTVGRVALDISSISRYRLAVILDCCHRFPGPKDLAVDLIYNLAAFSPVPKASTPNRHVGPVIPGFAGWPTEPDQPPIGVIGLGYEEAKALGALEHIQASDYWLFRPWSSITEYSRALEEANASLLEDTRAERIIDYHVEEPFNCFTGLELLIGRLRGSGSPLMFPFGPKIFSACCMLVACLYEEVSVWRVSAGAFEIPTERIPTSTFCGLRVKFQVNGGDTSRSS
jgi:hypothetical protein